MVELSRGQVSSQRRSRGRRVDCRNQMGGIRIDGRLLFVGLVRIGKGEVWIQDRQFLSLVALAMRARRVRVHFMILMGEKEKQKCDVDGCKAMRCARLRREIGMLGRIFLWQKSTCGSFRWGFWKLPPKQPLGVSVTCRGVVCNLFCGSRVIAFVLPVPFLVRCLGVGIRPGFGRWLSEIKYERMFEE